MNPIAEAMDRVIPKLDIQQYGGLIRYDLGLSSGVSISGRKFEGPNSILKQAREKISNKLEVCARDGAFEGSPDSTVQAAVPNGFSASELILFRSEQRQYSAEFTVPGVARVILPAGSNLDYRLARALCVPKELLKYAVGGKLVGVVEWANIDIAYTNFAAKNTDYNPPTNIDIVTLGSRSFGTLPVLDITRRDIDSVAVRNEYGRVDNGVNCNNLKHIFVVSENRK